MNIFRGLPGLRRLAWRVGRKLYAMARGEERNDPRHNGEYWLLEHVVSRREPSSVLLDVGANKGNWSLRAVRSAKPGQAIVIHAFEPAAATREILAGNCSAFANISIHPQALSDTAGDGIFYSKGAGEGTNSLNPISGAKSERVILSTCDIFLRESSVKSVAMLKIDTEGFDFLVIKGSIDSLAEGRIDVIQFEYNWRWLLNHACLLDVFLLIADKPYRLGKLVGNSIEFYDAWHFELDRFFENNYVLVKRGSPYEELGRVIGFDVSNSPVESPTPDFSQRCP